MTSPTTFFIAVQYAAKPDEFPIINETHLGGRHHSTTFHGFMWHTNWDEPPLRCIRLDIDDAGIKAADVTADVAKELAVWSYDNGFYQRPEWIAFYEAQGVKDYYRPSSYEPWKSETLGSGALL